MSVARTLQVSPKLLASWRKANRIMRILTVISLIISLAALTIAVTVYQSVDAKAAAAVDKREQLMILRLEPQLNTLYSDFHVEPSSESQNPKTIEELVQPLFRLVEPVTMHPAGGG
jgi:hypothetical protein